MLHCLIDRSSEAGGQDEQPHAAQRLKLAAVVCWRVLEGRPCLSEEHLQQEAQGFWLPLHSMTLLIRHAYITSGELCHQFIPSRVHPRHQQQDNLLCGACMQVVIIPVQGKTRQGVKLPELLAACRGLLDGLMQASRFVCCAVSVARSGVRTRGWGMCVWGRLLWGKP